MRRLFSVLLACVLVLSMASCGAVQTALGQLTEEPTATPEATEAPGATAEPAETSDQEPADEGYYAYLKETLLPELGTATQENVVLDIGNDGIWTFGGERVQGVLSADVRDYDGDGVRDMLVVVLKPRPMGETELGRLGYHSAESVCLAAELQLYTCKDGAVTLSDTVNAVSVMESMSWGPMLVGVQEVNGVPYIYGYSSMEDQTTYGSRPVEIFHVENGSFAFDLMGGFIGWGQGKYDGDPNEAAGATGMEILDTPLNAVCNRASELKNGTVEENAETILALAGTPLCFIAMEHSGGVSYQAVDYTQMLEIIERGEETVKAERTPMPSPTPEPESGGVEAEAEAIAAAAAQASGLTLTKTSENLGELTYSVSYEAPGGSRLSITYTVETQKIRTLGVYADGGSVTEEWLTLKDAVLGLESLGFDPVKVEKYLGDCGFGYSMPEEAGENGVTVLVGNAGTCTMLAHW